MNWFRFVRNNANGYGWDTAPHGAVAAPGVPPNAPKANSWMARVNNGVPAFGSREPNGRRTFCVGGVHHESPPLRRGPALPVLVMTSTLGASLLGRRQSSGRFP